MTGNHKQEYQKQYYKENKEKLNEYGKQWRKDNSKKMKEYEKQRYLENPKPRSNPKQLRKSAAKWRKNNPGYQTKWNKDNPDKKRKSKLKCKYDLSHEDWLKMWEGQGGKCIICRKKFTKPSDGFVDHNHKTNKVRGLLCRKCNFGLGFFNDDPKLTAKATEYLLGDE